MMVVHQPFLAHDIGETVSHVNHSTVIYYRGMWQITNQVVWFGPSNYHRFTATSMVYTNTLVGSNSF